MVGAVGEMASMKQHKLWKTEEDGMCCSRSAIQTQLGPSSLLEERSKTPIVFVVFVLSATPKIGGNGQSICMYTVHTHAHAHTHMGSPLGTTLANIFVFL